eukprot:CAMPEP_0170157766 /NCGR_PEP_ID=MMETSP0033_2-20121228/66669_1 /TAXON_ID=195969 /ORGANISM="Dolichomastix tenuilepis, Strain CCMP3274" /LENGTH=371 /DNA_ID=CAMNT_0010395171 /DNA_START=75 /DNA_END=1186 /DNA_ORIENTATION=-
MGGTTGTPDTNDWADEVGKFKCKECTQASDSRCSSFYLDSVVAGGGVKAAFCNDANLVIVSDGSPGFTPNLEDIPNPPGSFDSDGNACKTRIWSTAKPIVHKIPVEGKYTLYETGDRLNNQNTDSFPSGAADAEDGYLSSASRGSYGLPTRGAVGVSVKGQIIFPVFNNRAELTPEACEVDSCNEHVGGGGGSPHLHGDPWGSHCLYSEANYTSVDAHPPVIGFALDGPSIYGRHLSESAPGYDVALDACGGHDEGGRGYHYHSQVKAARTDEGVTEPTLSSGVEYPAFPPGVDECYRGNLASIEGFWDKAGDKDTYSLPCCGSTHYWVADGITIDGAGVRDASNPNPSPPPSPPPPSPPFPPPSPPPSPP